MLSIAMFIKPYACGGLSGPLCALFKFKTFLIWTFLDRTFHAAPVQVHILYFVINLFLDQPITGSRQMYWKNRAMQDYHQFIDQYQITSASFVVLSLFLSSFFLLNVTVVPGHPRFGSLKLSYCLWPRRPALGKELARLNGWFFLRTLPDKFNAQLSDHQWSSQ